MAIMTMPKLMVVLHKKITHFEDVDDWENLDEHEQEEYEESHRSDEQCPVPFGWRVVSPGTR